MSMAQVLKLKPAFTDEQAQVLAELFDEEGATKKDVTALSVDVEKLRIELKSEVEKLRAELKADIERLRLEVQRDIKAAEARLIAWMFGQGAAIIGILFALLRFVET
jgi:hypothetical protein